MEYNVSSADRLGEFTRTVGLFYVKTGMAGTQNRY